MANWPGCGAANGRGCGGGAVATRGTLVTGALCGRIRMRSYRDAFGVSARLGANTYPPAERSRIPMASTSGTFVNSSVTKPPPTRSALTILVCPTLAHSARIWPTVAFFADTVTRPASIVTCTSAAAGRAPTATPTQANTTATVLLPNIAQVYG